MKNANLDGVKKLVNSRKWRVTAGVKADMGGFFL